MNHVTNIYIDFLSSELFCQLVDVHFLYQVKTAKIYQLSNWDEQQYLREFCCFKDEWDVWMSY